MYCGVGLNKNDNEVTESFLVFFIPRITTYLFAVTVTVVTYFRARLFYKSVPENVLEANNLNSRNLLVYPATQLILYLPVVLSTLPWVIKNDMGSESLWNLVGIIFSGLRGLVNSVTFSKHLPQIKSSAASVSLSESPSRRGSKSESFIDVSSARKASLKTKNQADNI